MYDMISCFCLFCLVASQTFFNLQRTFVKFTHKLIRFIANDTTELKISSKNNYV